MSTGAGMTAPRPVVIVILLIALLAAPIAVESQPAGKVYRIGVLNNRTPTFSPASDQFDRVFLDGLQELGYVLGQNLAIEVRTVEREPDGPGALVASRVDVILAASTPTAVAAKKATSTVPIVFYSAADPVGDGLSTSFARPGGNVTGLSTSASELSSPEELDQWRKLLQEGEELK
jgi:putative ABC transport system substrate-binding protein